jgi:hypothetical protein
VRKILISSTLIALLAVFAIAQKPTKLFDVRNGGTTATTIEFRDASAKQAVIDAFAVARGYQVTIADPQNAGQLIPNPQSKQQFFNAALTRFVNDTYKPQALKLASEAQIKAIEKTISDDLPDQ